MVSRACWSLSVLSLLALRVSAAVDPPSLSTLDTSLGRIKGSIRTSRNGREYTSFVGIPYAKPPVNDLRFKSPKSYGNWKNELDASGESSPICTQIPFYVVHLRNHTIGQEDCLYVNVFTPKVSGGKLPVMVYIHGGGWRCGNPGPANRADFFMDEDVVLVTMNYRLGVLGFLSTEDEALPGNFGLKDQSLALKWIRENIADYGGNPESVTIFGESAGGASVHYHMMSPLSHGLFQRGISQSGTNSAFWAYNNPGEARAIALKVGEYMKCPINGSKVLVDCLMTKTNLELINAERIFNFFDFDPAVVFKPVIEYRTSEDAFLISHPLETETKVPWIVGITSGEGALKVASLLNGDPKDMKKLEERLDEWLPDIILYRGKTSNVEEISKMLLEKYFPKRPISTDGIGDLFSDSLLYWPSIISLRKHKGPVYYYYFDHRGEASLTDIVGTKDLGDLGVCHADELLSLFNWKGEIPKITGTLEDKKVSEKLIKLWVNFAKHGDPTPDKKLGFKWNKFGVEKSKKYLHMKTKEFTMGKKLSEDVIKFWDGLPFTFPTGAKKKHDEL